MKAGFTFVILAAATINVASSPQVSWESPITSSQKAVGNPSATGNLIFQSVSNLLQHWPNAKHLNGINLRRLDPCDR
jgi:hypothetical protein